PTARGEQHELRRPREIAVQQSNHPRLRPRQRPADEMEAGVAGVGLVMPCGHVSARDRTWCSSYAAMMRSRTPEHSSIQSRIARDACVHAPPETRKALGARAA